MHHWDTNYGHFGPTQEALNKHRHLVRDLTLIGCFRGDDMCPLPALRHLKIYYYSREMDVFSEREIFNWDLAEASPLLDRLLLSNLDMDRGSCQRLLEHPHLRNLELSRTGITPDAGQAIWDACKNLETLSMSCISFKGKRPSIPTDTVFTRLHTLRLEEVRDLSHSQQLSIVLRCPILESFKLKTYSFEARMMIKHPVQKNHWIQLDNLNILLNPTDGEWASILERIGNCFENVPCLHLNYGEVGRQSLKALGSYFSNLVDLRFTFGNSSVILDVLCSCPMLEILHVPDIFANDIAEGGPWVCQQLRELKIRIRVKETEQDLQPLVFERLSTLVRLTTLDMGCWIGSYQGGVLGFRLDCGLRQLASLQELRTLVFDGGFTARPRQQLEMKDVEWMIDNWKRLKGIYGHLNKDQEVEAQLKDHLGNRGILHGEYKEQRA